MTNKTGHLLVIDDDADVLTAAQLLLKRHYAQVVVDEDPGKIPRYLEQQNWDLILLDMNFALGANSGDEGLRWLGKILELQPATSVILMTAYGAVDTAVKALKQGAVDFILKPWHNERLLTTVANALQLRATRAEVQHLKSRERELLPVSPASGLIGASPAMQTVHNVITRVAPTTANVLVLGENGTGKEVVAQEIHRLSKRADEVFIAVDMGSVTESLFESELFGHKKGAFTGANGERIGRFQAASGGTLFLDEIGNLPLHLQGKLLSVLEQRQVVPVGANTKVAIDVRLICATNMPLRKMVKDGTFREDLLYRINTVEITLPGLRERGDDLSLLLTHFIDFYARKYNLPKRKVTLETLAKLAAYPWPGNVRELRHAVERAMIMGNHEQLQANELLFSAAEPEPAAARETATAGLDEMNLDKVEQLTIERALRKHKGNISHAAAELGITRTSLYRRMEKYGL
ncbi:MAG TPA: sigma-54 dependent transcriptional regulator [Candidatus Acidoferrum sp.]|nr:sigma-54 dependent transcriptional regulator [Candidatus Acidoferrum sp.]